MSIRQRPAHIQDAVFNDNFPILSAGGRKNRKKEKKKLASTRKKRPSPRRPTPEEFQREQARRLGEDL